MRLSIILLLVGFVLLIKGADFLVDGASTLAKKLWVSDLIIGLTIVAFGTSAPELVVNIIGSLEWTNEMILGNILGSNISNILLILGIAALIAPLTVQKSTAIKEIPFSLLGVLVLFVIINDTLIDGSTSSTLSLIDGIVLRGFFLIFLYYTIEVATQTKEKAEEHLNPMPLRKSLSFVLGGLAGLVFGGDMVVTNAVSIATSRGMSEKLIGFTILAIGTSLPELATTVASVRKGHVNIAIGNVVGSNIFNIFFVLATSALIAPLPFNPANNLDIGFTIFATALLFVFLYLDKKHIIQRRQGIVFLVLYVSYMSFLIRQG